MRKIWSDTAWEDYEYWQSQDKKTLELSLNKMRGRDMICADERSSRSYVVC